MPLGRKVADIYAELNLDKDTIRQAMAAAGGEMGADADRMGRQLGDRMSQGMAGQIEQLSTRLAKARLAEQKATDAVALAQARLNEAEGKGNVEGSKLLALQQKLSQAESVLAMAHDNTAKATTRHADAEKRLAADLENLGKDMGPAADRAGRDTGDKLSQGIHLAIIRNSPLIAAAVGGALAAGAPVAIAGATALFGGIAAVAVHNNAQIQSAFAGLKTTVTSTFTDAAQVTVPMFVGAMGRIGAAVQGLGPQFQQAFAALGVPIDSVTTGIINMAQNAMPGLVAAVQASGPVFQGLASLMGSIGTGLGQFFQIMSEHSQAAGSVLSSLGSVVGAVLPILGQLVGAGAELASQVLPPVVSLLHGLGAALNFVAPALPVVAAGLGAFAVVKSLSGPLETFAGKLSNLGSIGEKAGGALSKVASALPLIGIAVGAISSAFEASSSQLDSWAQALEQGGQAAATATQQLTDAHTRSIASAHSLGDAWGIVKGAFADGLAQIEGYSSAQDKATQKAKDYYNSLSPLGKAQADVTKAQNDYNYAVGKWGATSGQAIGAAAAYQDATQHEKDVQDQLSTAIHGVTQAMIDQANQALASANSQIAYQRDTLATKDAQVALADAIKKHGANSEDAQKATLDFNQALLSQAQAAGQAAADTSGLTDKTDLARVSQQATLRELLNLKQQYGADFPAALQNTIDQLQAAGVKLDDVGAKKPEPQVKLDDAPFQGVLGYVNNAIQTLHGQKPTPTAFMSTQPFQGAASWMDGMLTYLNGRRVTPSALLIANTLAAENALNNAARNRTAYITAIYSPGAYGRSDRAAASGGNIGRIVGERFDIGGKIRGPGGPTDDLVQAMTGTGRPLRVSNEEWVIRGRSSKQYGDTKMAAINAGTAIVSLPGRGLAGGGISGDSGNGGGTTYNLSLTVNGFGDLTDSRLPQQLLTSIQQGLVKLERSRR